MRQYSLCVYIKMKMVKNMLLKRIRDLREDNDLKQIDLAKLLNI